MPTERGKTFGGKSTNKYSVAVKIYLLLLKNKTTLQPIQDLINQIRQYMVTFNPNMVGLIVHIAHSAFMLFVKKNAYRTGSNSMQFQLNPLCSFYFPF